METQNSIKKTRIKWMLIGILIGALGTFTIFRSGMANSLCAQQPCTATNPCVINGPTYTTGSVCAGENSDCGYWSKCITIVDPNTNAPKCECIW